MGFRNGPTTEERILREVYEMNQKFDELIAIIKLLVPPADTLPTGKPSYWGDDK